jgi:hypothetical protein
VKVRGAKIGEATLRAGDEIVLGEFRLRFEDSAERPVVSYGTTKLPPSFARALKQSAYSGSFMSVEALADVASPEDQRGKTAESAEARLKKMLSRVSKALAALETAEQMTERSLDFVFEIEGAERAFAMLLDDVSSTSAGSPGAQNFAPASVRYRDGSRPATGEKVPQFTISRSIIKQVTQDGMPPLVSDAKSDPRLSASQSIA